MAPMYIVSGLPRSGTSLMMQMLTAGGIPPVTDELRTADADNPRGYFEFERVKGLATGDTAWVAGAEGHVVKVISALLPHLPMDYEYRLVFMLRDLEEVLASQRAMLIRRGEPLPTPAEEGELRTIFDAHLSQIERWLDAQPQIQAKRFHYHDVVHNPTPVAAELSAFSHIPLDEAAMIRAVDRTLYRNKR